MNTWLLVFLGGGIGSICRFAIAQLLGTLSLHFPWATLFANLISCLVLGYLLGLSGRGLMDQNLKYLLMTGFCGGFSTFSTFSGETLGLFQKGQPELGLLNIGLSVALCLFCIFLGLKIEEAWLH
ncbi:MAG TPA: fluoride efflux transporter CrcB [Saprospiraceae bacterium]|nr:fluoride efflux transporter CrcB [Saprospiraceae bacterium]HMQ83792.1 fluoride efflux transporter CrcB [Saprospiraceae bacterium]